MTDNLYYPPSKDELSKALKKDLFGTKIKINIQMVGVVLFMKMYIIY